MARLLTLDGESTRMPRKHPQIGLSVVEALVAAALLALTFTSVLQSHLRMRSSHDLVRQQGEALRSIQGEIETLRSLNFQRNSQGVSAWEDLSTSQVASAPYLIDRQVVRAGPQDLGPLKAVRVNALWTDRWGRPQTLGVDTLLGGQDPTLADWLSRQSAPLRPWP